MEKLWCSWHYIDRGREERPSVWNTSTASAARTIAVLDTYDTYTATKVELLKQVIQRGLLQAEKAWFCRYSRWGRCCSCYQLQSGNISSNSISVQHFLLLPWRVLLLMLQYVDLNSIGAGHLNLLLIDVHVSKSYEFHLHRRSVEKRQYRRRTILVIVVAVTLVTVVANGGAN